MKEGTIMIRTPALLAMAVIAAPITAAAKPPETVVVTISKADLALSDTRFRRKIASAIEEVCGSYAAVEPYQWIGIDECRQSAWAGVRRQLADLKAQEPLKLGER